MEEATTTPSAAPFKEEEKIRILLYEYAGLRSEITNRTNNGFQMLTVGGAVVIWLLSRVQDARSLLTDWPFWTCIAASVISIGLGSWFTIRDINKAAMRLREIEADINRRAGEPNLLQWETRWSSMMTGFWGRSRPIKGSLK
ncbi:MAG: hypothetical protein H7144_04125 [Burkholderiales bacterium]|nr:hypothetical protein [Phycisphaerae bacterium]